MKVNGGLTATVLNVLRLKGAGRGPLEEPRKSTKIRASLALEAEPEKSYKSGLSNASHPRELNQNTEQNSVNLV
jgi:hypothetical protein